jgi:hypothetical protein
MRPILTGFCAAACIVLCASPALAEVESASPAGFVVVNAEVVPVDPQTAWRALIQDVDRWWPKDHTWWGEESTLSIEAVAGGCFCERDGARQAQHLEVAFVDPPKLLRMVGGLGPLQGMGLHGALEWRLEALEDGGTRLTLRYQVGGYAPSDLSELAPIVDRVQALQLGGLAEHLRADHEAPRVDP